MNVNEMTVEQLKARIAELEGSNRVLSNNLENTMQAYGGFCYVVMQSADINIPNLTPENEALMRSATLDFVIQTAKAFVVHFSAVAESEQNTPEQNAPSSD